MSDLEKRLNQAADEVRQVTKSMAPPPAPGAKPQLTPARRGLFVFAGAFAVVALAIGVLPLLDRDPAIPVGGSSTTMPVAAPSTVGTTVPQDCSATGTPAPPEQPDLPDQIADVRLAIIEAVAACDLATLEGLAAENFVTHFGGGGVEELSNWEEAGEGKLGILLQILGMSYGVQETGDGDTYYVWPGAFAADSWDEITDEQMAEIRQLHTQEELDQMAEHFDGYAGWRTGINVAGDWRYFVAGD